jgi:hypothetical protein
MPTATAQMYLLSVLAADRVTHTKTQKITGDTENCTKKSHFSKIGWKGQAAVSTQ